MSWSILKKLVPLPDIAKVKSAVFIGPHPDDIEIGAGTTVHRLKHQGAEITYIICLDGGCGSMDPNASVEQMIRTRMDESKKAAEAMGIQHVHFLAFPDCGDYRPWDMALKIASILAQIRPEAVFCPDPDLPSETHPDHIRVAKAARTAVFMTAIPMVMKRNGIPFDPEYYASTKPAALCYYFTHRANCFVAIDRSDYEARLIAVLCHKSQFPGADSPEWKMLSTYMNYRQRIFGLRIFHKWADGYFVMAPVHQHCFPEVNNF